MKKKIKRKWIFLVKIVFICCFARSNVKVTTVPKNHSNLKFMTHTQTEHIVSNILKTIARFNANFLVLLLLCAYFLGLLESYVKISYTQTFLAVKICTIRKEYWTNQNGNMFNDCTILTLNMHHRIADVSKSNSPHIHKIWWKWKKKSTGNCEPNNAAAAAAAANETATNACWFFQQDASVSEIRNKAKCSRVAC